MNEAHESCDGCKHDLGGGCCEVNLESECREGGGFEAWERKGYLGVKKCSVSSCRIKGYKCKGYSIKCARMDAEVNDHGSDTTEHVY